MNARSKWNSKYEDRMNQVKDPKPNDRLKGLSSYLKGGLALDLACGLGGNSLFLAQLNYQVHALDISDVAVHYVKEQATKKQLSIYPIVWDLTEWNNLNLKEDSLDLVVITYYLDRSLFPFVKSIIKNDGYFFMETYYQTPNTEHQGVSDQYKLKPKELLAEFGDWNVIFYEENEQTSRQTIFCQKYSI